MKNCPICHKDYTEPPAISRKNEAEICPDCGTLEALETVGLLNIAQDVLKEIHKAKGRPAK